MAWQSFADSDQHALISVLTSYCRLTLKYTLRVTISMREIVGGVVRYRDLVAKIKIAKFFSWRVGDSRKFVLAKISRYTVHLAVPIMGKLTSGHTEHRGRPTGCRCYILLALFPGLPCFLFFGFLFSPCMKTEEQKRGRPGNEVNILQFQLLGKLTSGHKRRGIFTYNKILVIFYPIS